MLVDESTTPQGSSPSVSIRHRCVVSAPICAAKRRRQALPSRQYAGFGLIRLGPFILTTLTSPQKVVFLLRCRPTRVCAVFLLLNSICENGETPPPSPSFSSQAGLVHPVPPGPRAWHPHPRLIFLPAATMDISQTLTFHHLRPQPSCRPHGCHVSLAFRTPAPPPPPPNPLTAPVSDHPL